MTTYRPLSPEQAERNRRRVRDRARRNVRQRAREYNSAWRYLVEACVAHQVEIPAAVETALLVVETWTHGLERGR